MGQVKVVFYQDEKGCPALEWLEGLPTRVRAKAEVRIERLGERGHELRRPEADYLENGVYELRWRAQSVNYRILYFFYGRDVVVLFHGLVKEDRVPPAEIALALRRKRAFEAAPERHIYEEA